MDFVMGHLVRVIKDEYEEYLEVTESIEGGLCYVFVMNDTTVIHMKVLREKVFIKVSSGTVDLESEEIMTATFRKQSDLMRLRSYIRGIFESSIKLQ